jgi:hypothetical protein
MGDGFFHVRKAQRAHWFSCNSAPPTACVSNVLKGGDPAKAVHPSWLFDNEGQELQVRALRQQYVAMQPAIVAMAQKKKEQVKTLKILSHFSGMMGNELLDFFGVV